MSLRPMRDLILVERLPDEGRTRDASGHEVTAGGIVIPADYKAIGSRKAVNKADHWRARVVAVGPKVTDPLIVPGAEVQVLTWSEEPDGTRRGMYTGIDGPDGLMFVRPCDLGGVVMNAPDDASWAAAKERIADCLAGKGSRTSMPSANIVPPQEAE